MYKAHILWVQRLLLCSLNLLLFWDDMVAFDDVVAKAPHEAFLGRKEKEMRNKTEREPSLLFLPLLPLFYSNSTSIKTQVKPDTSVKEHMNVVTIMST